MMPAEVVPFPARRPAPANLRDAKLPCGADQLATMFNSLPKGRSMTDTADDASINQDQHLAASLSRIDPTLAKGVAGECDNCGDEFERLIGGLCGYCRDGRRPTFRRTAPTPSPIARDPEPVAVPAPTPLPSVISQEEEALPNPKPSDDFRNVSILARGPLLKAIMARADERDLSLNKAATSLIEDALCDRAEQTLFDLSALPVTDLLEEIGARTAQSASTAELIAMTARAEAAEARLAKVHAAIGGSAS
ncbi:hypothetical protein JT366_09435 [Sphingomonas paucimobilis]|uniref:hypothetical protein n=1 Tax=Sphingomonas paucimobilis TaxID=13689 RepID=UPI001965AD48|nr:hypothetical protein [Sphingomonas paucimobilis]QRY97415.1 hypothetical protein JT366_09435 [Sphingomonas paucimobilis]